MNLEPVCVCVCIYTFNSHSVSVHNLPLGVLSYTLVLSPVALRDIIEVETAVEHVLRGPRLRHFTVLPQP